MKRTIIIGAIVALLIAAGGWYWASPGYALIQLRDAAAEGDADALEDRIDFAAVRESLKDQLRAEIAAEAARQGEDEGLGAFGSALALAMLDPMIDGLVTAEGMAAMVNYGRLAAPLAEQPADKPQTEWTIQRDGLSRFRATPEAPAGEKVPTMVFERDGLGWKLVEIDIPAGGLGTDAD